MEKTSKSKMVNELLRNLGHSNIEVVENPSFYWNGNTVTSDTTAPVKNVATLKLHGESGFSDFLERHSDKKIVFAPQYSGGLISEDNSIRVCIL